MNEVRYKLKRWVNRQRHLSDVARELACAISDYAQTEDDDLTIIENEAFPIAIENKRYASQEWQRVVDAKFAVWNLTGSVKA